MVVGVRRFALLLASMALAVLLAAAAVAHAATLTGTSKANDLLGTSANDKIDLLGGNDRGRGRGGDDTIYGRAGTDVLNGGAGVDTLQGGDGSDHVLAAPNVGAPDDSIDCGLGTDYLYKDPAWSGTATGCERQRVTTALPSFPIQDPDADGVTTDGGFADNCPSDYNPDQADSDGDGFGDACGNTTGSGATRIKVECYVYGPNYVDPIVLGSGHRHYHFGNTTTSDSSTGDSLKAEGPGATSCNQPWYTAGSWFPEEQAVTYTEQPVDLYYRAPGDQTQIQDIPTGLEIVATDEKYHCGSAPSGKLTETPPYGCTQNWNTLLFFEDCWDRQSSKWEGGIHMAYSDNDGVCPAGYPYRIPQLNYKINHKPPVPQPLMVSAGASQWEDYTSMHADYLAANQDEFDLELLDLCLRNAPDYALAVDPRCGLVEGGN